MPRDLKPPPGDPSRLRGFPGFTIRLTTPLYRVVTAGNGPWWFGDPASGERRHRFDLPAPLGTCYVAMDQAVAFLEVFGVGLLVRADVEQRRMRPDLRVPRPMRLADLTSSQAAGFGVTAEIHTITPYGMTQVWAEQLHRAGFEGLRYYPRHNPSPRSGLEAIALFGKLGERRRWRRGREEQISRALLDRLDAEFSVKVRDAPIRSDLQIRDEPLHGQPG